jgi:hypothetical protein
VTRRRTADRIVSGFRLDGESDGNQVVVDKLVEKHPPCGQENLETLFLPLCMHVAGQLERLVEKPEYDQITSIKRIGCVSIRERFSSRKKVRQVWGNVQLFAQKMVIIFPKCGELTSSLW